MSGRYVTPLTPQDFDPVSVWLLKSPAPTLVLFYSSEGLDEGSSPIPETYEECSECASFLEFTSIDCKMYPEFYSSLSFVMPSLIPKFPTIIFYNSGRPVET